jgi:hypothetical protein
MLNATFRPLTQWTGPTTAKRKQAAMNERKDWVDRHAGELDAANQHIKILQQDIKSLGSSVREGSDTEVRGSDLERANREIARACHQVQHDCVFCGRSMRDHRLPGEPEPEQPQWTPKGPIISKGTDTE